MPLALKKMNPNGRVSQAVVALQDYIIKGKLKPGADLPTEVEMAEQIGVSKFSMREALRVAQTQGLISISRGRRTQVAAPSPHFAAEAMSILLRNSGNSDYFLLSLTEARKGLECQIAELAAKRAKRSHIKEMKQVIAEMAENSDNIELCTEKDIEFHRILSQASGNPIFEVMLSPVSSLLRKSRLEAMLEVSPQRAILGHKKILKAVMEKNPEKAAKNMLEHLQMAEEDLLKRDGGG